MITLDFSFAGVAALVVALTQFLKNKFNFDEKYPDKKLPKQLLSVVASIICCFIALGVGLWTNEGCFANFCIDCLSSWVGFVGTVIFCTGFANGLWTYDFIEKILGFINLLPKDKNKTE